MTVDCTPERRERLRELIDGIGAEAVLLRRPENFAWYTGGGNSRVEYVSPVGVADVVVTGGDEWVVTSTIEAPRMRNEEASGFEVVEYPWEQGPGAALDELIGGLKLAADVPLDGAQLLGEELDAIRRVLDPDAVERLKRVGADLESALDEAAESVTRGISEHQAADEIAAACRCRGLVPTVLLAATHERIGLYRHPLPSAAKIEGRAMLVASAQRGGLYANLTRIVHFDDPEPRIKRRQELCDEILDRMRDEATRPGRTIAEAFADCQRFYAEAGFPDEWRLHHQGGITGYASREVIATPATETEIVIGQAFSWNPSITGAKAEDTFLLTDSGPETIAGAEVVGTGSEAL
jgi:Xaa-Pro aminopeptidase